MSLPDEGGFDLVAEVAQQLVLRLAKNITIPDFTTELSFAGISGPLTVKVAVDQIGLGGFPNVNISVNLTGTTFVAQKLPWYLGLVVPPDRRTINITGEVLIPVPLVTVGLALNLNLGTAGTPVVSQDVFNSIFTSTIIKFLLAEAWLVDWTGKLAAEVEQAIKTEVTQQIQAAVVSRGVIGLVDLSEMSTALNMAIGKGISAFNIGFGSQSVFLLFTVGGTPGNFSQITRSDLLRTGGGEPQDSLDLIVSNACFLRDFIRPNLSKSIDKGGLGLAADGFLPGAGPNPGSPLWWQGTAEYPPAEGGPIASATINVLTAGVGVGGTNLYLHMNAVANGVIGSFTVSSWIDIVVNLTATISGGVLTLSFSPQPNPGVTSDVSIAWWVYVFGVLLGVPPEVIVAVANGFGPKIADLIIKGDVTNAFPSQTITLSLPAQILPLSVRAVSDQQADASPSIVLLGGGIPIPTGYFQNDVVMNFAN